MKKFSKDHSSPSGSGTVVTRTPRSSQSSSLYREQISASSGRYASIEDASTSGTVVIRGHDDSGSPQTPKSKLGIQERNSSASEDSIGNLAEAKAALDAGLRRGNARKRRGMEKNNNDGKVNRRRENKLDDSDHSRNSGDKSGKQEAFPRSEEVSDEEDDDSVWATLSASLSVLLVPSLKEALGDDSKGSIGRIVLKSLVKMEREKPGSCEAFIAQLIELLRSSKEASVKEVQDMAVRVFGKTTPADAENKRRQANKEFSSNTNVSPLGRFLLSRWLSQSSRDL